MSSINKSIISIIVPNYNHSNYLQERLDSIFNQSYQNFEVILLDDASTDRSLEVLGPYKSHPKVSHYLVNTINSGSPFKQWKKGLDLVKGDYIWIAESDDYCDLNFLESQMETLKNADVSVAKTLRFTNKTVGSEVRHHAFSDVIDEERILFCPILNVSAVVFKTDLLKNALNSTYHAYNIIGDRVFYYEYFHDSNMLFNSNTINYFRQSGTGVSSFQNKSIDYLRSYYDEHYKFISYAQKIDLNINNNIVKLYIIKFYNRVRYNISRSDKFSFKFFEFYLVNKLQMLKLNFK